MVLIEQLTHDQFRARFITPQAKALGATVGNDKKPMTEDDDALVRYAHDREKWPDYTHKLSDGENANYTKAMLTEAK